MKSSQDIVALSPSILHKQLQYCSTKRFTIYFGFLIVFCWLGVLSSGNYFHGSGGITGKYSDFGEIPFWRKHFLSNFKRQYFQCSPNEKVQFATKICAFANLNIYGNQRKDLKKELATSPRSLCKCRKSIRKPPVKLTWTYVRSSCSADATAAGENQKVISFSLYQNKDTNTGDGAFLEQRYFNSIALNLRGIKIHYPGWAMRVYTNVSLEGKMCKLVCLDASLFFCDVRPLLRNTEMYPMTWRFLPLGDPTVTKFASRDLNSLPTARERSAVTEWESSGFPFHRMRDHTLHDTSFLGGMWGADNTKLCYQNAIFIVMEFLNVVWKTGATVNLNDEDILKKFVQRLYPLGILTHDSYHCTTFKDSLPFPRKRSDTEDFVGKVATSDIEGVNQVIHPLPSKCPIECRPSYGLDWEYC